MRFLLPLLFATALSAQTDPRLAKVDALFSGIGRAPGYSIAVIQDGKTVLARGYGMADLERDVRITPRSVFDIGSTSKQFTAAAILLLEQEGKLSLDDDVRKHIPELPAYERTITIRHLLHHTSGLRDYLALMALGGLSFNNDYSDDETLAWITSQKALNFSAGDEHLYSNSGYYVLGTIVARASGSSLREYAKKKIFDPLGMTNTHFHDDPSEIVPHRAIGYAKTRDGFRIEMSMNHVVGDGGVYTTTEDLAKWDANFYDAKVGGAPFLTAIQRRGRLTTGKDLDYAAGLYHAVHNGRPTVAHGGAWAGYRADMIRFPEQKLTVIALANFAEGDPSGMAHAVADIYLGAAPAPASAAAAAPKREVVTKPEAELRKLAGLFREEKLGSYRTIEVRDGKLWLIRGNRPTELRPLADDTFELAGTPVIAKLDGNTIEVVAPAPQSFRRVEPSTPTDLAAYAGTYRSDEIVAAHRLRVRDGQLVARAGYREEYPLQPRERDIFEGPGVTFHFTRDERGAVTGYTIDAGRVKGIRFERR